MQTSYQIQNGSAARRIPTAGEAGAHIGDRRNEVTQSEDAAARAAEVDRSRSPLGNRAATDADLGSDYLGDSISPDGLQAAGEDGI
eukprot:9140598-Pyramimonas_sp.AAC.2